MCLITLNWQPDKPVSLLMAANRDEFYDRAALGLHHWPERNILAGQDLRAGGTWLGLGVCNVSGRIRLAALTNYRDIPHQKSDAVSRGRLTTSYLTSALSAENFLKMLAFNTSVYNPFNLILFDGQQLMGFESRHARLHTLPTGITSVSNADFNTPWPKLERLQTSFKQTVAANNDDTVLQDKLFKLLSDAQVAADAALPRTGLPLDRERALSAAFIRTPDYGTRVSSVIRIGHGVAQFTEKSFDANGFKGEISERLMIA